MKYPSVEFQMEVTGVEWGASRLMPVAFGIQKLAISALVAEKHISAEATAFQVRREIASGMTDQENG